MTKDIPFEDLTFCLRKWEAGSFGQILVLNVAGFEIDFRDWANKNRIHYRFLYKRKILRILENFYVDRVLENFSLEYLLKQVWRSSSTDFTEHTCGVKWFTFAHSQMFIVELRQYEDLTAIAWLKDHNIPYRTNKIQYFFYHKEDAILFKLANG